MTYACFCQTPEHYPEAPFVRRLVSWREEDFIHVADQPVEVHQGLWHCPLKDFAGRPDAEVEPIKIEVSKGLDEGGEESALLTKWVVRCLQSKQSGW